MMVLENTSEELNNRLKHRGLYEDRLSTLEKFNNSVGKNIKHGLNIRTEMDFIEYDKDIFNEGKTTLKINNGKEKDDNKESMGFTSIRLGEFIHSKHFDEEYKQKILSYIEEKFKRISSDNSNHISDSSNKLEYLHHAIADIQLIIFDKHYELSPEKNFKIERIIEGNSYNHLIFVIGKKSKFNIYIRTTHPEGYNSEHNQHHSIITDFTDILIDEGSHITILEQRKLSDKDVVYGRKNLKIQNDCAVQWISIDKDSKLTYIEQHTTLEGDDSKSVMSNITCGRNSAYTLYNISEHIGKNTESLMQSKIGLQESKAIIKGLIKIDSRAENSNGYQKSDILLMDENSRGISIPDLEIHNDKVKCTHGSTITKLDEEKKFYLQSRGLNKKDAERLLVEGFYDKILGGIADESLREAVRIEVLE